MGCNRSRSGAAGRPVRRGVYPEGTEFLHSVRYLDPDYEAKKKSEQGFLSKIFSSDKPIPAPQYKNDRFRDDFDSPDVNRIVNTHTIGGVVNVITKSGTNDPHGSLFYFQRLEALDVELEAALVLERRGVDHRWHAHRP